MVVSRLADMICKKLGFEHKQKQIARGCEGAPASPTKTRTEDEKQANTNGNQTQMDGGGRLLGFS